MSVVSEIKCARCDRKYSGLRGRCPYCGARRTGRGKYSDEEAENFKGKTLVAILIMVALVAATVVLVVSAPGQENDITADDPGINMTDDRDTVGIDSQTEPPPVETEPPEETEPPAQAVIFAVTPLFFGRPAAFANDVQFRIGESNVVELRILSQGMEDEDFDITWESDNPDVFDIVPTTDSSGRFATLTPTGVGNTNLRITVNDFPEIVYVVRIVRP
ncbi:MAG: hypothetical protein FWC96_09210 [Oscillospiraceae bacterium]|nr:hypothetical protein [Oscillospiraceae bacterium]